MSKNQRFELRIPEDRLAAVKKAASLEGFRSVNSNIHSVLVRHLSETQPGGDREAIIAATIERLAKEIRTLHTAHQALFALTESLTRLLLTCIPEPPPESLDQARRRARLRYDKFLISVAQNMTSDSRAALTELIDRA